MCKIRELNLGDGFPKGELASSYTPARIATINIISEVIGKFVQFRNFPTKFKFKKFPWCSLSFFQFF